MRRGNHRVNTAAHIEVTDYGHGSRATGSHEIIQDLVDYSFVKRAFVTVGPEVKLQRLELDTELIRHIANADGREIRLAGARTNTGELRTLHADFIVALRPGIGKGFEFFARSGCHRTILARRKSI